ncbi:hypothetical protein [Kingella potus]|uniref:hypothetical protein n=1 Tax=Kingella potus TaxID=265175 RepID=UPI001FD1B741|nr:hypothetical protein [Kingella potus]UOP00580.1 hypothetical protein LVJ84_12200 [Kingella potus]
MCGLYGRRGEAATGRGRLKTEAAFSDGLSVFRAIPVQGVPHSDARAPTLISVAV